MIGAQPMCQQAFSDLRTGLSCGLLTPLSNRSRENIRRYAVFMFYVRIVYKRKIKTLFKTKQFEIKILLMYDFPPLRKYTDKTSSLNFKNNFTYGILIKILIVMKN